MSQMFVLYHASCPDGFGAAWAAHTVLGTSASYLPVQYGDPIPDIPDGSVVYILDFSYDRAMLTALHERVEKLVVLDHHRTAQAELAGLPFAIFDMEKSGAVLAWEYFRPASKLPILLRYVQDRDLWRWGMLFSREFSAALSIEPRDFGSWDWLARHVEFSDYFDRFIERGKAILAAQSVHVSSLADKAFTTDVGGHAVPAVNSPIFQSEIGEELCKRNPDAPFAAVFFVPMLGVEVWSLRSRNGFDVSAVARRLGGGGHPAAAGFKKIAESPPWVRLRPTPAEVTP